MFGRFFGGRPTGITPPERMLFQFRDDTGPRKVDPLAAELILAQEYGPDWAEALSRQADDLKPDLTPEERIEAAKVVLAERKKLLAAADAAFGTEPYDGATGRGILDMNRLYLLGQFAAYLSGMIDEYAGS